MEHPITPPPETVQQWCHKWTEARGNFGVYLATQAARWGADQELEACCAWQALFGGAEALRAARRPKPPSLKQQALKQLAALEHNGALDCRTDLIRRALEALSDE